MGFAPSNGLALRILSILVSYQPFDRRLTISLNISRHTPDCCPDMVPNDKNFKIKPRKCVPRR